MDFIFLEAVWEHTLPGKVCVHWYFDPLLVFSSATALEICTNHPEIASSPLALGENPRARVAACTASLPFRIVQN